MTPAALTEQQQHALAVARSLAAAGIPVFVAAPDPTNNAGFALPNAWQQTTPDPTAVDHWRPGMALCALMGCGLDLIDVDTRNGGDIAALGNELPVVLASATTPSGGTHHFIRSLGVGSRDGILPGIDLKGGRPDGHGRGFAFIAPTVRPSKTTGELAGYRWTAAPNLSQLATQDNSGVALATRVRALLADSPVRSLGGPDWWREFLLSREPQAQAAADKAITEKLGEVTSWRPDSGANFRLVLMRAAMTLGGYVGGGYLAEGDAWVRLEQACAAVWGAADEDDRRWIGQGLSDGATRPFKVYTPADEALYGDAAQAVAATRTGPAWSPYRALGPEAFDPQWCSYDQEFAEAVAGRTAPVLRYAADASTWVVRGAEVWREREDLAGWAVAMVARLMPLGETPVPKDVSLRTEGHWQATRRQRFMTSGGASAIERKIKAIVRGGDHPSALELADLDTDPETLWAGGWPWDLRASAQVPTLAAIDPATPHLHTAACAPELRPTPVWDRFVATVWPDPELRAWAMRVLSVALAGYPDAALPVLYGPERTGKTSLVALLVSLLGTYGHAADPRLLGGADTMHASVVYALKGRRLSFIDEGPRRGHLATERLKQLTGGAQLTGNAMRANPVTFNPTHTLVMTTNDEPPITDPALRARMRIIPCEAEQTAVRTARQAITPAVWELEAPGVLAALMRDCAGWLTDPASALSDAAPAVQREQLEEMAAGQDPVRDWVEAWTVPTEEGTSTRDLYTAFVRWYGDHPLFRRLTPPTETRFGRSLTELGYPAFWGGPRGKTRYRALSVMGGGSGGSVFGSLIPGGGAEGLPRVAEGSKTQLSATDKPRSSSVFDSLAEGAEGITQLSGTSTQSLDQKRPRAVRHEDKITKAEARRRIAEEKRLAAIAAAAGEHVGLPAVATREGTCCR
jgi:P4 family phage/plasmid primase-like protien